jgi:signal transduction histidine kinase
MSPAPFDLFAGLAGVTWPMALTMAAAVVRDRLREKSRRRVLNEHLHELRRPLQALTLAARPAENGGPDPLELALAALRDLDREVNGGPPALRRRPVEARMLAIAAAERWRARVAAAGRRIAVRWACEDELADVDPVRVAQALDNLIANALEHGGGPITIEGRRRRGRIELAVRDGGSVSRRRLRERHDPRRGHGLRVTRSLVQVNGGRLRVKTRRHGTVAALELPLAPSRQPASPPRR